jgi:NodT family efflux transporter outer membrane factor (OMF) lipoprotein
MKSVAVATAAVGAMAMGPPSSSPPVIALPAAYGPSGSTTPSSSSLLAPATLDRWWALFSDPTLDALEAEALGGSPDAQTLAARLLEAKATRRAQTAATLPSGSASANASRQRSYAIGAAGADLSAASGTTDTVAANLNVSWELDLFGRLKTARRVANASAAEARFNVEGSRAALAADVADAYFQARGLVTQLTDARETLRIQNDLLDIARRRAEAGAGPPDAVDEVVGQVAQARAQIADLRAQLEDTRRRLLILAGRDLRAVDDLPFAGEPPTAPAPPAALPAELLTRRPDIREAEYRLRAELGTAHLAHLAVFPTLTLLPGLGGSSIAQPGVSYIPPTTLITSQQVTTSGFWTLAAGLTAPTLDIPKLLDQAKAEDARARQAAIAYEKTVRNAFGEARGALTDLEAGERASALLTDGEARARRAYDASRRRYAEGLDDLSATLTAEQSWRTIRSALTSERVETLRRAVRTYKALGGGWDYAATPVTTPGSDGRG